MNIKEKIIDFLQKRFGQKMITEANNISYIEGEIDTGINDFNKSLIVEGVPVQKQPKYEQLSEEIKKDCQQSLRKLNVDLEDKQYKIKEQNEGYIGDKPFICYAYIGNDGEIKSTIIVTPEASRKIEENENEENKEYVYQESREYKDGIRTIVAMKEHNICIDSKLPISQKELNELIQFSKRNKENINKNPKLNKEELEIYKKTMKQLGVNDLEDNKENYTSFGNGREIGNALIEVNGLYDKTKENSNPEVIGFYVKKDGKYSNKKYRLTESGQYIDESSFKVVNGKPEYKLISYDKIKDFVKMKGLELDFGKKVNSISENNNSIIPQEAISIHKDAVANHEKQYKENDKTVTEEEMTI